MTPCSSQDNNTRLVDAHCHLSNSYLAENLSSELQEARKKNICEFISTALTVSEMEWHLNQNNPSIKVAAGIHPLYEKDKAIDLQYLDKMASCNKLWAIGEVGLDKRIENHEYQYNILCSQLEIAAAHKLPVIFHIVGRYNELFHILRDEFPNISGYIHGFTGSRQLVKMLTKVDIGFSLGYKALSQKKAADSLAAVLDYGFFFMESDAPYQKDPFSEDDKNHLAGLIKIPQTISELTSYSTETLISIQWRNFMELNKR